MAGFGSEQSRTLPVAPLPPPHPIRMPGIAPSSVALHTVTMAPRARRRAAGAAFAAQPAASPACGLADVPAGVLQHILGFLESCRDMCALSCLSSRRRRHCCCGHCSHSSCNSDPVPRPSLTPPRQSAARVCRRWYDCVHSGDLSLHAEASISPNNLAALDSFTTWLLRHGRLVRSVRLRVRPGGYHPPEEHMLLGCCLTAAAAPGRLERLSVSSHSLFVPAGCLRPLRSLRELALLASEGESLYLRASLEQLSQLTALRLRGGAVMFEDDARLPPSLLRLEYAERFCPDLPSQVCLFHLVSSCLGRRCA